MDRKERFLAKCHVTKMKWEEFKQACRERREKRRQKMKDIGGQILTRVVIGSIALLNGGKVELL